METIKINKIEYDRLCKFEKDIELNRITTIDKYMVANGTVAILRNKIIRLDNELYEAYKSIEETEKQLQSIKDMSIFSFLKWKSGH